MSYQVGDWVILNFPLLTEKDNYYNVPVLIQGIKNNDYYYDPECTSLISEKINNSGGWIITGLWKPKDKEWVIPKYSITTQSFEVVQFDINKYRPSEVEPFCKDLPSILKRIKNE